MRQTLTAEPESLNHTPMATEGLPVHAYHAVIQQLKQQKSELTAQHLSERRKAKASDSLSSTVLANLPSGVLFVNTAGLVRQANSAARSLLGFASPAGLHVSDLFRAAVVRSTDGAPTHNSVEQALAPALSGKGAVRGLLLNYVSRSGDNRVLEITASPVMADDASLMGTTLVLSDKTDIERIRHDQRVHREISQEMAEELRTSLASIGGYAQQLSHSPNLEATRQLADNIASEASKLDRTIGSFLEAREAAATSS
jgi:nitrogen-specific signal transduction histidine kinase